MFQTRWCTAAKLCPFFVCLSVWLPLGDLHAAPAAPPPNAGNVLNNTQTTAPPPPQAPPSPGLSTNEPTTPTLRGDGLTVAVSGFHFSGDGVVPTADLHKVVQSYVGKELTFDQIRAAAAAVTRYLRHHGFFIARAYVPRQQIASGVVVIQILAGRFGVITVRNMSSVNKRYVESLLGPLREGDVIRQGPLERTLLLLTDTSGAHVRATLSAGADAGTSDLLIEITNDEKVSGELTGDNWGDRYTGRYRGSLQLLVNNLTGGADALNLGDLYAGAGLNDYDAGYTVPTGPQGAKLTVSYSRLNYQLGANFSNLGATGIADVSSVDESYPFIRSRTLNVSGQLGFDNKILKDEISEIGSDGRKRDDLFDLGASGDVRDADGKGTTSFHFTINFGNLILNSPNAVAADTLHTSGAWNKETLNVVRQQTIAPRLSYYINVTGQLADKNLDSSEQLILGGANGVRAYPQGEASGDEGYLATAELRWNLPTPALQLAPFLDSGSVRLARSPIVSSGNTVHLAGGGLGIIVNRPDGITARLDYAVKLTDYRAVSDTDRNGRLWFTVSAAF